MGIIRAITNAVGGGLADQWLEVIEPDQMSDHTVFAAGVQMRRGERNANTKKTSAIVSNGSVIHVYPNQFMILVDGGRIVIILPKRATIPSTTRQNLRCSMVSWGKP